MDIKPVCYNKQCSPNFNGYVDKSVKKVIKTAFKNFCDDQVVISSETKPSFEDISLVKQIMLDTLAKLENFMSKTHPKTALMADLKNPDKHKRLYIYNSYFEESLYFTKNVNSSQIFAKQYPNLDKEHYLLNEKSIEEFKNFAEEIENINPKSIDEKFLDLEVSKAKCDAFFTSWLSKLQTRYDIKIIKKFAKQIGKDESWIENFVNTIKKIQQKETITKK